MPGQLCVPVEERIDEALTDEENPSSIWELQLSSIELQLSTVPGLIKPLLSLQSVLFVTYPDGAIHNITDWAKFPKPSPSLSA
jgi:hypothetical protein